MGDQLSCYCQDDVWELLILEFNNWRSWTTFKAEQGIKVWLEWERNQRWQMELWDLLHGEQRNKANSLWGKFTKPQYYTVSSVYFVSVVNFGPQSDSLLFFLKDYITTSWAVLIWLPSVFSCLSTLVNIFFFFFQYYWCFDFALSFKMPVLVISPPASEILPEASKILVSIWLHISQSVKYI